MSYKALRLGSLYKLHFFLVELLMSCNKNISHCASSHANSQSELLETSRAFVSFDGVRS